MCEIFFWRNLNIQSEDRDIYNQYRGRHLVAKFVKLMQVTPPNCKTWDNSSFGSNALFHLYSLYICLYISSSKINVVPLCLWQCLIMRSFKIHVGNTIPIRFPFGVNFPGWTNFPDVIQSLHPECELSFDRFSEFTSFHLVFLVKQSLWILLCIQFQFSDQYSPVQVCMESVCPRF